MAFETSTTSANDITYSAAIAPVMLATLAEQSLPMTWLREFDITSEASNAIDIPVAATNFGTADDDGAGVDVEYNAAQGVSIGNTMFSTDKVTLTAAEYGIGYAVNDNVTEDSIRGIDIFEVLFMHMSRALALAWTDDFCALFASLSNSVGSTGVDLTVAQMLAAQTGIRRRGGVADDGLVYVLDNQQVDDLEGVLISTNAAQTVYSNVADRVLGAGIGANNGMGADRMVLAFRGYPVVATGLTDTANAAADVVGACFTPSGPRNDPYATFGNVFKRSFRLETDRDIHARSTSLVLTARMAPGELQDGTGSKIVTDA